MMNNECDHAFFHDDGYKECPSCGDNLGPLSVEGERLYQDPNGKTLIGIRIRTTKKFTYKMLCNSCQ